MSTSSFYSGGESPTTNIYEDDAAASAAAAAASEAAAAASAAAAAEDAADVAANNAAAAASAAAADASAGAAAVSATNADASEAIALTAANNASTAASNSASSATTAATSASNAATSATNAASSAAAAASSATSALNSATSASTSASAASGSQIAAATSATNAAASASQAATSATNAGTSASNAANSATSSSSSATTATTQAGIATTKASEAAASATAASSSASSAAASATDANSAKTAAESARDATLAAFDSFDDRYLGTKTSDPTLDNDGNALVAGALYFNSVDGVMKVYTGSLWTAAYVSGTGVLLQANNLSDLANAATARTNLGLGNVENKSSATIRSEITSANVTTALGYTPYNGTTNPNSYLSTVSLTANVTGTLPVTKGGTGATSLTSNYLVKGNGTSAVSASVVYDDGTNVGIGTASPASKLDVNGQITVPDQLAYDYTTSVLPDVTPALNLNFVQSKVVDPRITFTRSSTATFVGSNGLIQTAAVNTPRLDYDPVTRAPKGLLIEEQRTNLLLRSEGFDNGTWSTGGGTFSANVATAPDGTNTADALVEDTANSTHFTAQGVTVADNTTITASCFIKAAGRSWVAVAVVDKSFTASRVWFNVSTGVQGTTNGTVSAFSATNFGNGWYRISVSASSGTGAGPASIRINAGSADNTPVYVGNGTAALNMWGAQVEAGAFATSYIPTVASQVTRTADVATMTGTNFSQWYNQSEGTFVVDAQKTSPSGTSTYAYDVTGATSSFSLRVRLGVDARMQSIDGGVVQVDTQIAAPVPTTPSKYALAYKLNDYAGSANGATVATDSSATVPSLSALNIGFPTVTNIHIRSIQYYNTRLANTVLQGITA